MSFIRPRLAFALAAATALMTSACVVTPLVVEDPLQPNLITGARPAPGAGSGLNPVIQALTANPTATNDKNDKITFTVVANAGNQPMQYNWSATKGSLSSNSGLVVYWSPTKSDGSLDSAGDATISVIITTAQGGAVTGSVNVRILPDGTAAVTSQSKDDTAATTPAATATPAAAATAEPTAAPSASPTTSPAASEEPKADDQATDIAKDKEATGV